MQSKYDPTEAADFVARLGPEHGADLALRVYTSQLLGRDASLVLHGGGNTSVKTTAVELDGSESDVLYVKGSGWDLKTIEPAGFPACRLEPLVRYAALDSMTDEQMVQGLRSQMLDPTSPTPSVEALLHAIMPGKFVDHTHSDAVLKLVDQPDGLRHVQATYANEAVFLPYVMPGFQLAASIRKLLPKLREASVLILDKHGIFTWGETAQVAYERMIDAVSKAESYVSALPVPAPTPASTHANAPEQRRRIALAIRGAIARGTRGMHTLGQWTHTDAVLSFLSRPDAQTLLDRGTITPDHVIRIKPRPLHLEAESSDDAVAKALDRYVDWYDERFTRLSQALDRELTELDPWPRLVAVPGLGVLALGKSLKACRISCDLAEHMADVMPDAERVGRYEPLDETELFQMEYWSLEQAKLARAATGGGLAGRVAWVTGAASGIGLATATALLGAGACVMLADLDGDGVRAAAQRLAANFGACVRSQALNVTDGDAVQRACAEVVDAFGAIDIVVSNAGTAPSGLLHTDSGHDDLVRSLEVNLIGHQHVARAATRHLLLQDAGGCLLFNASKSAFNQGSRFGPYAVAKTGLLALMRQYAVDLGRSGIRSNAVNADRIRTALFDGGVLETRAKARGVSPDEYFQLNLLGRETTADDVARAFVWLATAPATTGCVVTVDGGNAAAFPR